ncbi:MAG: cation-translocating P-type ATPase, partial [Oscillospiraceae bacterium]|nr:cation-translocating P-type ATPase [Oscillospiraceae bacterium]
VFFEQYKDFLVIILIAAAVISGVLGDWESAIIILVVITINAILGTVQHCKAQQSLDGLKAMSAPSAKVLRDGEILVVEGKEVTVGDVLILDAGDFICADGRILECASLKVAESALTGESEPVEKEDTVLEGDVPLGDRKNMVYSGSFVTYGRARVLVTGIGMKTEIGKIATLLKSTEEKKTPLQVSLDSFGKKLSIGILIVCALVFGLSLFRGNPPVDAFVFAVALAVAAIPEALSSIVTIVLAMGTQKLAKENAIIRKLQAVEGLGSVSIICSDKTGTLTQNKMTIRKIFFDNTLIDENDTLTERQKQLVIDGLLCNDATVRDGEEIGDPTEVALVNYAEKHHIASLEYRGKFERLGELPFDSDRKLMSTIHKIGPNYKMLTKGAVDVLIPRILEMKTAEGKRAFTPDDAELLRSTNLQLSEQGLRVLALCERDVPSPDVTLKDENGYILLGLFAMQDPPRVESADAVAKCKSAGIRPIMITGDHLITASAIAKQIGILDDEHIAVEGAAIENLSDEELQKFVEKVSVYARVSPEHKIRIVNAWQARGNIVSMTGDGVNDAPALKAADIGCAMGITGTDVAKGASDMTLTDDNFATIVDAVEEGRGIYANIKKVVAFLLSTNIGEVFTVFFAMLMWHTSPLLSMQLLWINLVTDSLPAIALGMEAVEKDVMDRKPKPKDEGIFAHGLGIRVAIQGVMFAFLTLVAFWVGTGLELVHMFDGVLLDEAHEWNLVGGQTLAFMVLALCQIVQAYNMRSEHSLFKIGAFGNKNLNLAALASTALMAFVLFTPGVQDIFNLRYLTWQQYVIGLVLIFVPLLVMEISKAIGLIKPHVHKK